MFFLGLLDDQGKISQVDPVEAAIRYGLKFWFLVGGDSPSLTLYDTYDRKMATMVLKVFTDGQGGFEPGCIDEFMEWVNNTAVVLKAEYIFLLSMDGNDRLPGSNAKRSKLLHLDSRRKNVRRKEIVSPNGDNLIRPHPQMYRWGGKIAQSDAY